MDEATKNYWDTLLTIIGMGGALIAFALTVHEWRESQRWKRSEKLDSFVQTFEQDPLLRIARVVLDWTSRKSRHENREVVLSNKDVLLALRDHKAYRVEKFVGEQPLIRDAMDALLAFFSRLGLALDTRLVDEGPARSYFQYWMLRLVRMDVHSFPDEEPDLRELQHKSGAELVAQYVTAYGDAREFLALCRRLDVSFPELDSMQSKALGKAGERS